MLKCIGCHHVATDVALELFIFHFRIFKNFLLLIFVSMTAVSNSLLQNGLVCVEWHVEHY